MSTVSKLLAGDDTFREVADLMFGGGGDELVAMVSKMEPTQSDLSTSRKKRERTQARVGLATNIVGIGAGAAATPAAVRGMNTKYREMKGLGEKPPGKLATKVGRLEPVKAARKLGKKPKVALGLAAGAAGLQVANLGGDFVANRVLARSAKKDPDVLGGTPTALRAGKRKVHEVTKSKTGAHNKSELTRYRLPKETKKGMVTTRKDGRLVPVSQGHAKVEKYASGEVDVLWDGEFAKADEDKQQVFGWASVVEVDGEPVLDRQGDIISTEEMEKAGYSYVQKSRKGGDMHLRDNWAPIQKSEMIESFIVTPEKREAMGLPESVPTGWWVGFQVQDPQVWTDIKAGKRTGFSIHGTGKRRPT